MINNKNMEKNKYETLDSLMQEELTIRKGLFDSDTESNPEKTNFLISNYRNNLLGIIDLCNQILDEKTDGYDQNVDKKIKINNILYRAESLMEKINQ